MKMHGWGSAGASTGAVLTLYCNWQKWLVLPIHDGVELLEENDMPVESDLDVQAADDVIELSLY